MGACVSDPRIAILISDFGFSMAGWREGREGGNDAHSRCEPRTDSKTRHGSIKLGSVSSTEVRLHVHTWE